MAKRLIRALEYCIPEPGARCRDEFGHDQGFRTSATRPRAEGEAHRLAIEPIDTSFSFKNKAYAALKNVIVAMDIYRSRSDIRLDERQLAQDFGISRTPVREAMAQLEREGSCARCRDAASMSCARPRKR